MRGRWRWTPASPGSPATRPGLVISGLLPEDRIAINNPAALVGTDPFGVVLYQGIDVATVTGGNGTPLIVTFLDTPTRPHGGRGHPRSLVYSNASDAPTATRTLHLELVDVHGGHLGHPAAPGFVEATEARPIPSSSSTAAASSRRC